MITQKINLNLIHGQVHPRVNVSQYDNGSRTLQMTLYNGDQVFNIASGMTAVVQGTKPDRTGFQYAATITEGSNIATLDITQQMTAVKGDVTCELVISNGNNRIATANFILSVEAAALSDDTVISETDLPLIEEAAELAERIDGIVQQVDEDAQTASNAATAAQRASEAATTAQDAAEDSADKAEAYGTHPPYIGANGNWYVYNVTTQQYEDSGVKAQGPLSGLTDVEISNPAENDIIAYDATAQKWKNSSEFQTLTNQVKDMNNVLGAKNLLPNTATTQTLNGITFTVNDDGSVTANGTVTGTSATVWFYILGSNSKTVTFPNIIGKTVKLTGCPAGGSANTYLIRFFERTPTSITHSDYGDGTTFTVQDNLTGCNCAIGIAPGQTVSNLTFKPMLTVASIEDDTYVPYAKTNKELTDDIDTVSSQISDLSDTITTAFSGMTFYSSASLTLDKLFTLPTGIYQNRGMSADCLPSTWGSLIVFKNEYYRDFIYFDTGKMYFAHAARTATSITWYLLTNAT